MTPAEVEHACRDLGWRITCERPTENNPDRVFVAWIRDGHGPRAGAVGMGMSAVSPEHAIRDAWRSARETMGCRLVHRLGGTIEWDGETFTVRDRWFVVE